MTGGRGAFVGVLLGAGATRWHPAASCSVRFIAAIELARTEAERSDELLSWRRSDRAFFASGACHILGYRFRDTRGAGEGWTVVHLRPRPGLAGNHVYVSTGEWAFDFNGWTPEPILLAETARRCRLRWPDWDCDRVVLTQSLDSFCSANKHRLPTQYPFDPIARADNFIAGFGWRPPQ